MLATHLCFLFSKTSAYRVVFLRHAESLWNKEKKFSGWADVRLSSTGIQSATKAGKTMQKNGLQFDICYTSVLTRAIQTFNYAAEELHCHHIPVVKSWKLNERHYGALEGLSKIETVQKYGKEQVKKWRRSFDIPPPVLEESDERHPRFDRRYSDLDLALLPKSESLKMTIERAFPYWNQTIVPTIKSGKKVIVVAHGNVLRGLVMALRNLSDSEISEENIPTSVPLIYDFDEDFKVVGQQYLAQPQQLQQLIDKVKKQTVDEK